MWGRHKLPTALLISAISVATLAPDFEKIGQGSSSQTSYFGANIFGGNFNSLGRNINFGLENLILGDISEEISPVDKTTNQQPVKSEPIVSREIDLENPGLSGFVFGDRYFTFGCDMSERELIDKSQNIIDYLGIKFDNRVKSLGVSQMRYSTLDDNFESRTVAVYKTISETGGNPKMLVNQNFKPFRLVTHGIPEEVFRVATREVISSTFENEKLQLGIIQNPAEFCSYVAHEGIFHYWEDLSGVELNPETESGINAESRARRFQQLFLERYSTRGKKKNQGMQDNIDFRNSLKRKTQEQEHYTDMFYLKPIECNNYGKVSIELLSGELPVVCRYSDPSVKYNDKDSYWKKDNSPLLPGG